MKRAVRIAMLARRYRLLADRPEFLRSDPEERVEAAIGDGAPGPLALLDAVQAIGSGELDRMCAYAVRCLRVTGKGKIALLDVLGTLDPDRLVAMYCALPEGRRYVVLSDPAWAYYVRQAEEDIPDAQRWLDAEMEAMPADAAPASPTEAAVFDEIAGFRRAAIGAMVAPRTFREKTPA